MQRMNQRLTGMLAIVVLMFATLFAGPAAAGADNQSMDLVGRALVVSVEDAGATHRYQMVVNGEEKTYHTANKSVAAAPGEFVAFKAKDDRIVHFNDTVQAASFLHEKIMTKDTVNKKLELELSGVVPLAANYAVYEQRNSQLIPKSLSDVLVGAENVIAYFNSVGQVDLVVLDGPTPVENMRIGIMTNGFASLEHDRFDVKSAGGMQLVDKKANRVFDIAPNTQLGLVSTAGILKATVDGVEIYATTNRLYIQPVLEAQLQVMTFKRAYGNALYRGWFEVTPSKTAGKLNVINELDLEQYLYQVVPSEMPASFGLQALKAQSVAARTYALSDYLSNRYAVRGFHVDDSTLSQVYNNSAENALTTQAVNETSGLVMKKDGALVDARYYSTSGGYGANKHEVWADSNNAFPGTPIPYLIAQSYTYDPADPNRMLAVDTANEAALNAYYKNLSFMGYDSDSLYFRWKAPFTKSELEGTINSQLGVRYAADPKFILTQQADGSYASKSIPAGGAGTIHDLTVTKRGAGGNMMELVITGSTGTYKIVKEYNIRFTIRPSKSFTGSTTDMLLHRAKGGSTAYDAASALKNYTILPSSFASFDIARDASGALTSVTFYGGGNGHGVGMSQYGASALGAKGWSYDRILNAYYAGMQIVDVNAQ